ncbi:T9SS type A sorting domain-containing protein [Polaribacter sp.]|uniref:T9SS type A sorting domain-containing protein n=1 Tax=Polaribacter sp. TaxID=1920175 RepID=UPI003F6AB806
MRFQKVAYFLSLSLFLVYNINYAQLDLVSNQQINFTNAVSTVKSGNWTDTSVWSNNQVPDANTDVIISESHTVYVDKQGSSSQQIVDLCNNLKIEQNAVLQMGHNKVNFQKDLRINGSILCNGTFSSGRNQPTESGDGIIYDNNSRVFLNLSQQETFISGSGFFNPKSLSISSPVADRNLTVDIYNLITDENFAIKSTNRVSVTITHFSYVRINKILGITGSEYQFSSPTAKADLTIHGIVVTDDVSLFTKNTTVGESSSITIENQGSLFTQKINNEVLDRKSEAAEFNLTINYGGLFRLGKNVKFNNLTTNNSNFNFTNNGELRRHFSVIRITKAEVSNLIDANDPNQGADVSEIVDIFGSSHIAGWYNFTDKPYLLEGLDFYKDFGATSLKTSLTAQNGNMESAYHFNQDWPNFQNLKEVAQHQNVDSLFKRNHIKKHTFWTTTKNQSFYKEGLDFNHQNFLDQEQQFYDLTKYLLETYGSMNKSFIYQNWEGDWMLRGQGVNWEDNASLIPDDIEWLTEGMARLFRARQRGVERARNEHTNATAKVFHAIEFNKMWMLKNGNRITMIENNTPSVIENVIPHTRIDLSSWSAYDGDWENTDFPLGHAMWRGLEIARYFTTETKELDSSFPVQIGEFGINENPPFNGDNTEAVLHDKYGKFIGVALGLGIPNFYLWNLYGNDRNGPDNFTWEKDTQYEQAFLYDYLIGKWLVKPDGSWGITANFFMNQWNKNNKFLPNSGSWNTASNWSKGTVPTSQENIIIPTGKTLTISAIEADVNGVNNFGTINLDETSYLKVQGGLINNGSINLSSNATNSAVLIVNTTSVGNVNYTRGGLEANKWSLISSPIYNQKVKEFAEDANNAIRVKKDDNNNDKYAIGYYDDLQEEGHEWVYFTNQIEDSQTFTTGRSYAISRDTNGSVTFRGTMNLNDVSKTVIAGSWNAIGNPYTTYYPTNKNTNNSFLNDNYNLLDDNFKAVYVWDNTQNKFVVVSELDAQHTTFTPGQGFFVKVKEGITSMPFKKAKRIKKPLEGNTTFNKSSRSSVILKANNGTYNVTTEIKFFEQASLGFDVGLDIGNFSNSSFDIFSYLADGSNNINYAIQSLPENSLESIQVPLGVFANNETIIFSAQLLNISETVRVFLEDKEAKKQVDITSPENSYSVFIEEGKNVSKERFFLHFKNANTLSSENLDTRLNNKIIYFNRQVSITNSNTIAKIEIYNIVGQKILSKQLESNQILHLNKSIFSDGVYIIKAILENRILTKKIMLE